MYELILDLTEDDSYLYSTGKKFWVGVIEGMQPSPPVPRRKTNCFRAADVYSYFGSLIFSMPRRDLDGNIYKIFFWIPENETQFIQ